MKEYIERRALIDKIFPIGVIDDGSYAIPAKAVKTAIDNAPAPDVVEVVRCKDCKHLEIDKGWQGGRACLMRGGDTGWCHDNDFCSYGERKEK